MKKTLVTLLGISLSFLFLFAGALESYALSNIRMISTEELKEVLDNPAVRIIDVRRDWERSDLKIKGAVRENADDVKTWAKKYQKDQKLVLYCS
jgi:rhodanese-related sulfurtransferase